MKKLRRIGLVFIAFLLITACGNDSTNENNPANNNQAGNNEVVGDSVSPAVAEQANTVFSNRCIQCHGSELQGLTGDKSNLQTVGAHLSREEIATIIREGRSGTPMPAFEGKLSEDEIDVLAEWLAAKK